MAIKAPFNFVPVSDKVYFPDWADKISHDIPFSDGISGTIDLTITAESPIFVRNGHTEQDRQANSNEFKSFSNIDGKYFIPGTSLKGPIRNVMEIMSFGKMRVVDNKRYSLRDLQLKKYTETFQNAEINCGWMRKEGNKIIISDHGIPYRVSHKELDKKFNTNLVNTFENPPAGFFNNDNNKSSLYKYRIFRNQNLNISFSELPPSKTTVDKRKFVTFSNGDKSGTIVFTGQPGQRKPAMVAKDGSITKKASGKFFEFIFSESKNTKEFTFDYYEEEGKFYDFKFIYNNSDEWRYWHNKLKNGVNVPIFFIKDQNGEMLHFGLSYLYKLPFLKKIKEYLSDDHLSKKLDMSESIFGTVEGKNSLKGRVSFSNSFAKRDSVKILRENLVYMGSPKPTYYPIYLQQKGANGYLDEKEKAFKTMLDADAKLKGWKRYLVQNNYVTHFEIPNNQEENSNPFVPIDKGAVFNSKVRFFNLKAVELGLLLLSIEENKYYFHNLGFAKSYGYGKVSLVINKLNYSGSDSVSHFIELFEKHIETKIENYNNSDQIKELRFLRSVNEYTTDFSYMGLKEFVNYKKHNRNNQGQYLQYLSNYKERIVVNVNARTEAEALVTIVAGRVIKAKLLEGDDTARDLEIPLGKNRPKQGKKIIVEVVRRGGSIDKLIFKKLV